MAAGYEELSLADYVAILRRRWRIIAAITVGCTLVASVWSMTRPNVYEATTKVLVAAQPANQALDPTASPTRDVVRQFENELLDARSTFLLDELADTLGYEPTVRVTGDSRTSDLLSFTATGGDPAAVKAAADAYADLYIAARTDRLVNSSSRTREAVLAKLTALNGRLNALDSSDPARESLQQQISLYEQYTNGLDLVADLAAASDARVVATAETPIGPISPKPLRTGVLAFAVGLMLGAGLAFVRDFLDDAIRTREDLEAVAAITTLAMIPTVSRKVMAAAGDPGESTPLSEPFRNLRTAMQFAGLEDSLRSVQVTSALPNEGKTTVAINLALAIAQGGADVVLIDADLRNPTIARRLGLPNEIGLTTAMTGRCSVKQALQPLPGQPTLRILTSGPTPENAADFLSPSGRSRGAGSLSDVIGTLVQTGHRVIVDSPPVLPVADAQTISRAVSAALFVCAAEVSRRRDVARALGLLDHAHARVVGTVLNRASDAATRYAYGYPTVPQAQRANVTVGANVAVEALRHAHAHPQLSGQGRHELELRAGAVRPSAAPGLENPLTRDQRPTSAHSVAEPLVHQLRCHLGLKGQG